MGCATSHEKGQGDLVKPPQPLNKFRKDALTAHNTFRKKHGVAKIKMDEELNAFAQEWAEELLKTNTIRHRPDLFKGHNLGENVATKRTQGMVADYTGNDVVDYWYSSEVNKYSFEKEPETAQGFGHFTQIVWDSSTKLGIGKARNDNHVVVVANYLPAGNLIGHFMSNVPKPKEKVKEEEEPLNPKE